MSELSSIFKNGGPNYSFGRVFSGLVILLGMAILSFAIVTDYNHPTKPVQMTRVDKTIETVLVAEPNFGGYQSFMIGLATLAGAIYGMSKVGSAADTYAANSGLRAAAKVEPPVDPKPPRE
jgi:hypothetical protein